MKKLLYIPMLCSTTTQLFSVPVSCSSTENDLEKIVDFEDPQTDERWKEIMTDYAREANDIWDSYEQNWISDLDSQYNIWLSNHNVGDTFNDKVNEINAEETKKFISSHDLQLIMAYEIGYYYCSLKRTDLAASESIYDIENYVSLMSDGYDTEDEKHIEHPIVFYQSVTYPGRYEGVGDGIAVDLNYNVEEPSAILDYHLIDRLEKSYSLIDNDPTIPSDNKTVSLGNIFFKGVNEENITTDDIKESILNAYNKTENGFKDKGYNVKEIKLTIDSESATVIDADDNQIPVVFKIILNNKVYNNNGRRVLKW